MRRVEGLREEKGLTQVYLERHAPYYDLLYQDKDYEKECEFIKKIFERYSMHSVRNVLDAGCGTGNHAFLLARDGYEVVGFDVSEAMINEAMRKTCGMGNPDFHVMDIRDFQLDTWFDACICMFSTLGYVNENHDVHRALKNIRRHLKEGSLFIFDFWNGLAVLRILPSVRVKVVDNERLKITRVAEPELDSFHHICKVHYRITIIEGKKVLDEIEETHPVRFYFPQEIIWYLEDADFEVLNICPFLDLDGKVDENIWTIAAIARAGRKRR